ncbi:MAG: hypothetical protein JWP11_1323 [Frankiales bacterium]|nr:hypothetical protein [Frankiales bacterium]
MTAAYVDVLDLAGELAAETFYDRDQWVPTIEVCGGARRCRYLIEATGRPLHSFTPELLRVTAMAVVVLERSD